MMTTKEKCELILKDSRHKKYMYSRTFQRHLDDLIYFKDSEEFRFNQKVGSAYVFLIEQLKHYKGRLAGQPMKLELWQQAYVEILFGWEWKNSRGEWIRRFSVAYTFIARKNGKSILASAASIADVIIRGEHGGEVKMAATKKEQADIVFKDILSQFRSNRDLADKIKHTTKNGGHITYLPNDTTFTMLGNESTAATEDGFNASIGIIDEYSAHKTSALYDIVQSSMGSRRQPLMFMITTAGFNMASPSLNEHEHSIKVLMGTYRDDHYFAFLASPITFNNKPIKKFSDDAIYASNPNIGVSVERDFLFRERDKARQDSTKLVNYLTKHENRFVAASEVFINIEDWRANHINEQPDLMNATDKILGLDLSLSDDFTALAILYKLSDEEYYLKTHFYVPQDNILVREKQVRAPLSSWVADGFITATPGNTIDFNYIYNDIVRELTVNNNIEPYNINMELNYDAHRAVGLITKVENEIGVNSKSIRQGFITLSEPTKMFLDLTKTGKLLHDGNPVMNWMVSNLAVTFDPAGNMKPDKTNPNRKIDGCAATINCLAGIIDKFGEDNNQEIIWI